MSAPGTSDGPGHAARAAQAGDPSADAALAAFEQRRAALAKIGAIAAVAPAVALLLRPDPGRAQGASGSPPGCDPSNQTPNKCPPGSTGFIELQSSPTSLSETTTLSTDPTVSTSLGISTSVEGFD